MTDAELLAIDSTTITDPLLLIRKMNLYLSQNDNIESNMGLTHDYWICLKRYREITAKP